MCSTRCSASWHRSPRAKGSLLPALHHLTSPPLQLRRLPRFVPLLLLGRQEKGEVAFEIREPGLEGIHQRPHRLHSRATSLAVPAPGGASLTRRAPVGTPPCPHCRQAVALRLRGREIGAPEMPVLSCLIRVEPDRPGKSRRLRRPIDGDEVQRTAGWRRATLLRRGDAGEGEQRERGERKAAKRHRISGKGVAGMGRIPVVRAAPRIRLARHPGPAFPSCSVLIDVHAHFLHELTPRKDWRERNASRLSAGERVGISWHVASVLGTWGLRSPIYFPSAEDVTLANEVQRRIEAEHPDRVRGYVLVNPNYTAHAIGEIDRGRAAGMIGVKLAASRRADDPLLDPVCEHAARYGLPILQHIWQHRRRDFPGQEASDAGELVTLARRHGTVAFILAHIGGGGDWLHSLRAVRHVPNVFVDLSGSGVDGGMLEASLEAVGAERLLWGCDLTIDTGWAKLRWLERALPAADLELIRSGNARRIFPQGAFPEA